MSACSKKYPDNIRLGLNKNLQRMISTPSVKLCKDCHAKQFEEWAHSMHAKSWTNGLYRMSAGNPPTQDCRNCHSMYPLLIESVSGRLSYDLLYRPLFRDFNQDDGIGCVTCHLREDGKIAAKRDVPDAPCKPVRDERISSLTLCGSCHNPTHFAIDQFAQSRAFKEGKTCNSCHTPHRFYGGFDEGFVKKAVKSWIKTQPGRVLLYVENLTAHKFPAEVPTRTFIISYKRLDAQGNVMKAKVDGQEYEESFTVLKLPPKGTMGIPDNRLLPDETREFVFNVESGQKSAVITLYFRSFPLLPRDKWFALAEHRVVLE